MNRRKVLIIPLLIFLILLCRPYFIPNEFEILRGVAENGDMNISKIDLTDTLVELSGKAESYPGKLLTFNELQSGRTVEKPVYTELPSAWKTKDGIHVVTQRIFIHGLEPGKEYGLQIMDGLTAFRIYAGNELISSNGNVSENPKEARPEADPTIGIFTAKAETVSLLFQVSNYESNITGLWQKMYFGTEENIIQREQELERVDTFIFGVCLIMALYHWILFFVMRRDKAALYFAAFCTLISIKVAFSGQQLGFVWYPVVSYKNGVLIAYLVIPWIAWFCVMFAKTCFPEQVSAGIVKISLGAAVLETLVLILTTQAFFQETFIAFQIYIVVVCAFLMYWIIKAIKVKKAGAGIYFVGFLAVFVASINDILYNQLIITTGYYLGVGLFIMILSQSAVIAIRVLEAFISEENLRNNLEVLVAQRTNQLKQEKELFEHLSKMDGLTHLYNKRFLMEAVEIEYENHTRYASDFSVIMADIDRFKEVNDRHGHLVGDEVLVAISDLLQSNTRKTDVVGRFGGEEFLLILRHTDVENAIIHAENLRKEIDKLRIKTKAGELHVTMSFGVATVRDGYENEETLLKAVDDALYLAKLNGRNRVEIKRSI